MSLHQNEGVGQTFRAGEDGIAQWHLFEPDGNEASDGTPTVTLCGATPTGPVMQNAKPAAVTGDLVTGVRLTHYSSYNLVSSGAAISKGDPVFHAANGTVAGSGTQRIGVALSSTNGAGDYVTVMPD